jgi:2-phosphosulfolactate phosphatase
MNRPHYQVMCTWGLSGLQRMSTKPDVIIWVNGLSKSAPIPLELNSLPGDSKVLLGSFIDAFAVADWVAAYQLEQQRRLVVLLICADSEKRNVADELAAGAIVERLAQKGLDAMSPEAAVVNAAFIQLRNAAAHLIAASEQAQGIALVDDELALDESLTTEDVRVLR